MLVISATVNPFISADGMLNFDAVAKVQEKVAQLIKADKQGLLKVVSTFVISRRAKPAKFMASLEKKQDLKYLSQRALKIAERKRLKPESLARVAVLLQVIEGDGVNKTLQEQFKKIASAVNMHMKKIVKVQANLSKKKAAVRDEANAAFEESVDLLKDILERAGVKENAIVEAQGMMGKTVLVKVGPSNVVSIGRSDMTRFRAAMKVASGTSESAARIDNTLTKEIHKAVVKYVKEDKIPDSVGSKIAQQLGYKFMHSYMFEDEEGVYFSNKPESEMTRGDAVLVLPYPYTSPYKAKFAEMEWVKV